MGGGRLRRSIDGRVARRVHDDGLRGCGVFRATHFACLGSFEVKPSEGSSGWDDVRDDGVGVGAA